MSFARRSAQCFDREYHRAIAEQLAAKFEEFYPPLEAWFEVRAYPSPEGLSVYFHDVTERRRVAEALRESEERYRLLADMIPQNIWTTDPDGYHNYFSRGWYDYSGATAEESLGEGWQRIRRSIRTSIRLIDDLLEMARTEAAQIDLKYEPTDVGQIALEVAEDFRAQAIAVGLQLNVCAFEGLQADTDPIRLRQIVANLLSNAVKYAPEGQVTVETESRQFGGPRPGPWVTLSVTDTGPGIPADKRELIFQEYTRLDPEAQHGAGIGLAISRRIARLLGGDLTVESEFGRGSTFTLWLPAPTVNLSRAS